MDGNGRDYECFAFERSLSTYTSGCSTVRKKVLRSDFEGFEVNFLYGLYRKMLALNDDLFAPTFKAVFLFDESLSQYISKDEDGEWFEFSEEEITRTFEDCLRVADEKGYDKDAMFSLWNYLVGVFGDVNGKTLYEWHGFERDMTDDELEFCRKKFPNSEWKRGDKAIVYRGFLFPIEGKYGWALALSDDEANAVEFDLVWDWWYPIDRHIFLVLGPSHRESLAKEA